MWRVVPGTDAHTVDGVERALRGAARCRRVSGAGTSPEILSRTQVAHMLCVILDCAPVISLSNLPRQAQTRRVLTDYSDDEL